MLSLLYSKVCAARPAHREYLQKRARRPRQVACILPSCKINVNSFRRNRVRKRNIKVNIRIADSAVSDQGVCPRCEGCADAQAARRCSALTRRCVVPLHMRVNSAPAKGCVWPVAAPARAWVRAGAVLRDVGSSVGAGDNLIYSARKKAQRRLTSQAALCRNTGMKG